SPNSQLSHHQIATAEQRNTKRLVIKGFFKMLINSRDVWLRVTPSSSDSPSTQASKVTLLRRAASFQCLHQERKRWGDMQSWLSGMTTLLKGLLLETHGEMAGV